MRILERVQAFLPLLTIEIFLIFPPSYVVSKLSDSHRALVSKYSYLGDNVLKMIQSKLIDLKKPRL